MLKLPKTTANNIPLLAMDLPTMRSRILTSKLIFLHKLANGEDSLGSQAFRSIAPNGIESMSIVRQCRFLELPYSSDLTSTVLSSNDLSPFSIKKRVKELDHSYIFSNANGHASQSYVLQAAKADAWSKFWDEALDRGSDGTSHALAILRTLCKTVFSDQICSVSNCSFEIAKDSAPCEHFLQCHTHLDISMKTIMDYLLSQDYPPLFNIGHSLLRCF